MNYNPKISISPKVKQILKNIILNGIIIFILTWIWFVIGILIYTYIDWEYIIYVYIAFGIIILYIYLLFSKIKVNRDYHLSFGWSLSIGLLCSGLAFIIDFLFGYESIHILIYYIFSLILGSLLLCEITKNNLQFIILYILQVIITGILILQI
jgi:hypothetical protein